MRTRLAAIVLFGLFAGCGTAGNVEATAPIPSTTSTSIQPAVETTTTTVQTTTSTTQATTPTIDSEEALSIAEGFLSARNRRDVDATLAYLARDVVLDMGPGRTYETLPAGMAWEDVFGFTSDLQDCEIVEADTESSVVFCEILVQTSINEARGGAPGIDCVQVTIENELITHAVTGVPGPDCVFDYWSTSFAPFEAWLRDAHPETTLDAMYDDRLSPEGRALWDQYITEYLEQSS